MPDTDQHRATALRNSIVDFLNKRRDDKLEALKDDDDDLNAKRMALQQQFVPATWLEGAARRVSQIQVVTHTLKPVHPDAKGSSLFSQPTAMPALDVVGSHCLGEDFAEDVVGNAAALDVYKLLKLAHQGQSLLSLILARDADLAAALSDDPAQASDWMAAFASIVAPRGRPSSHTNAKQTYWLVGDDADPRGGASYHLLAPLHASSLAHRVYLNVSQHRFGEGVKETRQARRDGLYSEQVLHDYPEMAVQKLGGTKPQNISQLNLERRGNNNLLASLPPVWKSATVKPLLASTSALRRFERRPEVRRLVKALLDYLKSDPARTLATRKHRESLVNAVIDELLQFAAEMRTLPPGWSQVPECRLNAAEKHWLDPRGVFQAAQTSGVPMPADSAERISRDFANWLNAQLRDPLPMGDPEFLHWRSLLLVEITNDDWESHDDD